MEIQIKRSWVEHAKTKSGEDKLNFRIYYYDELARKWRKKGKRIKKNTPQARKKALNELKRAIETQYSRFQTKSLSVGELKEKYFEYINSGESGLHYQTGYVYESNINIFLRELDASMVADEITTVYMNKYFNKLLAEGKSWSYVNLRRAAIASFYQFGISYGYCTANPLAGYKLPHRSKTSLTRTEDKYFTPDEFRAILKYYDHYNREDIIDVLEFVYFTGLRFSEVASLYPKDIFKSDGIYYCRIDGTQISIHNGGKEPINRSYVESGKLNGSYQGENIKKQNTTKSDNGMRFIKLEQGAIEVYKRRNKNSKYLFVRQSKPAKCLRPNAYGKPFRYLSLNKTLKNAAKKARITKNVTSHFLRHTYVSRQASYGRSFDYDFIRQIGHGDAKITHEIYDHINTINHEKLAQGYRKLDSDILNHRI